jgi:hypothetical protein
LDDLGDLAGINRRQFDELGKDVEAGGADVDGLSFDAFFGEAFLESFENDRFASGFLGTFGAERFEPVLFQAESTGFVDFELSELEAACPKIDR